MHPHRQGRFKNALAEIYRATRLYIECQRITHTVRLRAPYLRFTRRDVENLTQFAYSPEGSPDDRDRADLASDVVYVRENIFAATVRLSLLAAALYAVYRLIAPYLPPGL